MGQHYRVGNKEILVYVQHNPDGSYSGRVGIEEQRIDGVLDRVIEMKPSDTSKAKAQERAQQYAVNRFGVTAESLSGS